MSRPGAPPTSTRVKIVVVINAVMMALAVGFGVVRIIQSGGAFRELAGGITAIGVLGEISKNMIRGKPHAEGYAVIYYLAVTFICAAGLAYARFGPGTMRPGIIALVISVLALHVIPIVILLWPRRLR
jgi:hypothetical protein